MNTTMICRMLIPNQNDMQLRTVAVKSRKDGTAVVKEIVRLSVDTKRMYIKDVACMAIAGYVVDWSPEGVGRKHQWSYEGYWGAEEYCLTRAKWKIQSPVINPEIIKDHPRFKYSAWTPECGDVIDYLKRYVANSQLELVSKLGLGHLTWKDQFIGAIKRDPLLLKFVVANRERIRLSKIGVTTIRYAYNRGLEMDEAMRQVANRKFLLTAGLPKAMDANKVRKYLDRQKCLASAYCLYLRECIFLERDLDDSKNSFPLDFAVQSQRITQLAEAKRNRMSRQKSLETNRKIREVVKAYLKMEIKRGNYLLVLPRRVKDFVSEGKALKNCIGNGVYEQRMADRDSLIAFIRRKDDPKKAFAAVEYALPEGTVRQCYVYDNQPPTQEVKTFAANAFKHAA